MNIPQQIPQKIIVPMVGVLAGIFGFGLACLPASRKSMFCISRLGSCRPRLKNSKKPSELKTMNYLVSSSAIKRLRRGICFKEANCVNRLSIV